MIDFLIKPWAHQLEAIERAKNQPHFALFFEMGTGKTATTINILRYKYMQHGHLLKTLILCPPIVIQNWKREFAMHSKINPDDVIMLSGAGKKRLELLDDRGFSDTFGVTNPKIFITNYETLLMPDVLQMLKVWHPECLVLDESHKCKDMTAKRTKYAVQLSDLAHYKYILSGTPILNSAMDVFAQYRILDGGETFGKNQWPFKHQYFYDKNAGMSKQSYFPDWRIRPGAFEEINKKIYTKGMRVKKEECLDLPPLVKKVVYVDMTPDQKRMYLEMKKHYITFINEQAVTAELAITKALRMQQIVTGFVKTEEGDNVKIKKTPRQEALKELLEEITPDHKVLVWAVFKENYEQIKDVCTELKLEFVEVHGGISEKQKFANVDTFNNSESCKVFIGHPGSGGIGINLVAASYSIFYSRSFSLEYDLQAEARNYRGGSERHARVTRIDIVTQGTIDEVVMTKLANKQAISESVLKDIAGEI